MNKVPPRPDPSEDVDDRYRRASALEPSRPSETVRRAVLAHAAQLASERAGKHAGRSLRAGRQRWRRPAIFGTLAAAALAGLMIAPRFVAVLAPRPAPMADETPAPQGARPAVPPAPEADTGTDERRQFPQPAAPAGMPQPRASLREADVPEQAERAQRGTRAQLGHGGVPPAAAKTAETAAAASAATRGPGAAAADFPASPLQPLRRASSPTSAAPPSEATDARREGPAEPGAAFRHAAEVGDLAGLEVLLAKQVDINSRDPLGRTALMLATLHGQSNAVAALLAYGADPNVADAHGTTALQVAVAGDQKAMIATLQRYGAR